MRARKRTLPRCGAPVDQLARLALYVQDCVFDHRAELRPAAGLHTPRIRSNCVSTTTAPADPQSSSPWLSWLCRRRGRRSTEPHVSCSARGLGLVEAFVLSKRRVTFGRARIKPRDSRRSRAPRRRDLVECVHRGGAHTPRASQESNSRAGHPWARRWCAGSRSSRRDQPYTVVVLILLHPSVPSRCRTATVVGVPSLLALVKLRARRVAVADPLSYPSRFADITGASAQFRAHHSF